MKGLGRVRIGDRVTVTVRVRISGRMRVRKRVEGIGFW